MASTSAFHTCPVDAGGGFDSQIGVVFWVPTPQRTNQGKSLVQGSCRLAQATGPSHQRRMIAKSLGLTVRGSARLAKFPNRDLVRLLCTVEVLDQASDVRV